MLDIEDVAVKDTMDASGDTALMVVDAGVDITGEVMACRDPISFWGGVDPNTSAVIDPHHPRKGKAMAGKFVLMPTSRGSCSGSGVLLELALQGRAPAALVFAEDEMVLTLGAVVADRIFARPVTVLRVSRELYRALEKAEGLALSIRDGWLSMGTEENEGGIRWKLVRQRDATKLRLTQEDESVLHGERGLAARQAMEVVVTMAVAQGASELCSVSRGHVDGCILAHNANLIFAEKMRDLGARVVIPTTINAISVDRERPLDSSFGKRASRLADAYVDMGCAPTFTCAPYLLQENALKPGDVIAWSESNAVIFANTVGGARTEKLPDYLDLCVAVTGRAPRTGMYTEAGRRPTRIIDISEPPESARGDHGVDGEAVWPVIGWLVGKIAPGAALLIPSRAMHGSVPYIDESALCDASFMCSLGRDFIRSCI